MLTIRNATSSDWPLWQTLDGHIGRALFERKAAAGECYIAELDGKAAGIMRWNLFWDSVPFCTLLYIRKDCRGRGVGRAMMERWEGDMRALGHGMAMTSTQSDETAQSFYRRLGWRDAGGFAVDVPGYEQPFELILLKALNQCH